jgi:hypothetical protein
VRGDQLARPATLGVRSRRRQRSRRRPRPPMLGGVQREGEVPQVAGRKLHLPAAGRAGLRGGHHAGVVDEDVERSPPAADEPMDGLGAGELELDGVHGGIARVRRDLGGDVCARLSSLLALTQDRQPQATNALECGARRKRLRGTPSKGDVLPRPDVVLLSGRSGERRALSSLPPAGRSDSRVGDRA